MIYSSLLNLNYPCKWCDKEPLPVNLCTYILHVWAGGFCAQGDQAYRASQGGVTGGSEGLVHPRANED